MIGALRSIISNENIPVDTNISNWNKWINNNQKKYEEIKRLVEKAKDK